MNNQELELRVKEILHESNFFDMILKVKEFEKEYKNSEFYRATKLPLIEVIKNAKMWYLVQLDGIINKLQNIINQLDLTKVSEVIEQLGEIYSQENAEIMEIANSFKEIIEE